MLLSLDPGKKACGVALFENRELVAAWLSKGKNWLDTSKSVIADLKNHVPLSTITHFAAELPQIYTQNKQKGDPNKSLTPLILVVGAVGMALDVSTTTYLPFDWKRDVEKPIMLERIWARLSVEERGRVVLPGNKKNQGDVKDAIGVGLRWNKRL